VFGFQQSCVTIFRQRFGAPVRLTNNTIEGTRHLTPPVSGAADVRMATAVSVDWLHAGLTG